MTIFQLYLWKN